MKEFDITVGTDGGGHRPIIRVQASSEGAAKLLAVSIANANAKAQGSSDAGKFKALSSKSIF